MRRLAAAISLAFVLALVLHDAAAAPAVPWKPVSFEILEDWDKGTDLQDVEADFRLFDQLGIHAWRGSIGWDDFEPRRGRYDFAWLQQFIELAARHGLELHPYVGYTPAWAARAGTGAKAAWQSPPADAGDWARFAGAIGAMAAKHPNVRSLEIYNEEDATQWWTGSAEDYARVLVSGSRAIHAQAPGMPVLFGGLVYPDAAWTTAACRVPGARDAFAVLPIHAYVESWLKGSVEHYLDQLQPFLAAVDGACGAKPIWINEAGFPTSGGRSERDQAAWWIRAVATFLAHPRVQEIGVYEIKDLRLGSAAIGDAINYHLGITYSDRRKKEAFGTVRMLAQLLGTGRLRVDDAQVAVTPVKGKAGDLFTHLFARPDGDRVLIVWDRAASPALMIQVPDVKAVSEYALDGHVLATNERPSVLTRVVLTRGVPRVFRLRPLPR